MTWIIVSIPLMVLAVAIAVLPVLLTAIWEARDARPGSSSAVPAPAEMGWADQLEGEGARVAA
jgi:hypothetical protein